MPTQHVLCLARGILEAALGGPLATGLTTDPEVFRAVTALYASRGRFVSRAAVEDNPAFLQAIVYGIITDGARILALWRRARGTGGSQYVETRHNGMIGLAAGGHVEPADDAAREDLLPRALARELSEEFVFTTQPPSPRELHPVGLLYRDGTAFDRVHLGFIFRVPVAGTVTLPPRGDEYDRVVFLHATELRKYREAMEGWGQILTDALLVGRISLDFSS